MKTTSSGCWLVVYVCYSRQQADDAVCMLESEGFLVDAQALPGSAVYELRVLASEAAEARRLLMEKGL